MYFFKIDIHLFCVLNIDVHNYSDNPLMILIDLLNKGDIASQNMMRAVARQVCEQMISGKVYFLYNVSVVFKLIAGKRRI